MSKCWFRHKWSKYTHHEYDDDIEANHLAKMKCVGLLSYIPTLQIRKCERCGKEQHHDFRQNPRKYRPEKTYMTVCPDTLAKLKALNYD